MALHPPQLDQVKVPSTDFRAESATIDTRQRLKLRRLFQTAGVECKPNEEVAAAGRLLSRLDDWRTRTAALPQWFADARAEADRLVEPTTRHLKLESITLRTPEDVKTWTRQRLLEAVEHGPIVID